MVKSMPEIQLLSEHQTVEYGPVPFPKKNTSLWLPKKRRNYFDFRKHHYYRRHSFAHYITSYSVDTDGKTQSRQWPNRDRRKRNLPRLEIGTRRGAPLQKLYIPFPGSPLPPAV